MKPRVSIIIVNWNGGDVFKNCLDSLNKLKYDNWELIVVDNGSSDGSEKLPKNYAFPLSKYKLVKNKKNVGFAPANNQGLKFVKGKYVLLLNNDTKVPSDFLDKLIERMEKDKSIGAMQPKIRMMDQKGHLDNAGSFLTKTGFLQHWGFGEKDSEEFDKEKIIFSAKGACLLSPKSVIDKVGLFDDTFVSYFEETDYCWRVWLAGYKVLYSPVTSIEHKVGMTSKRMNQIDINYNSYKNRIRSLIKNLSFLNLIKIGSIHLVISIGLFLYYLVKLQFDKAKIILSAYTWNIRQLPDTLKLRRHIQKNLRVEKDETIFKKTLVKFDLKEMVSHFKHIETNFESIYPETIPLTGRVRICLEKIRQSKIKGRKIIDVGCSFGWLEKELENDGFGEILGIDPTRPALDLARKRAKKAKFMIGDASNIPVKDNYADIIVLFDVIEHVPKKTELVVLKEIYRSLKTGGYLLLSTPNSNFLSNLLDPAWYFGHRHYDSEKLSKIIKKAGFVIEETEVRGGIMASLYMNFFYISKWIFGSKIESEFMEKLYDKSYDGEGSHTLFIKAKK